MGTSTGGRHRFAVPRRLLAVVAVVALVGIATVVVVIARNDSHDEASQFGAGNYSDPAKIHGMDMPGMGG